jgi:hypothetical protein
MAVDDTPASLTHLVLGALSTTAVALVLGWVGWVTKELLRVGRLGTNIDEFKSRLAGLEARTATVQNATNTAAEELRTLRVLVAGADWNGGMVAEMRRLANQLADTARDERDRWEKVMSVLSKWNTRDEGNTHG